MTMPLPEIREKTYHAEETPARPGTVLGKQAILKRFPWITEAVFSAASKVFPVALTESWVKRATGLAMDPLLRQALPDIAELMPHPTDQPDPVGDMAQSPVPWLVQKHPDRALLLVTKRCHLYCRFCFRRDHKPSEALDPTPEELELAIQTAIDSGAREIILSGGDPLSLSNEQLALILQRIRPHFKVVRIHTRAPISSPSRVDAGLIEALSQNSPVWLVVHCNHPNELDVNAKRAVHEMRNAGISILNQSVLLKGVNDDLETLVALSESLVEIGVAPYYLHHTDPVPGNNHFRVSTKRGLALHQAMKQRLSGVALPAYVVDLPDGSGKIPVSVAHERALLR
jgi:lysine 2,3-aminomutase